MGTAPWFLCRIAFAGSVPSRTGPPTSGPVSEDAPSNLPLSPYVASKSAAESLLYSYHHLHGMDAVVLRYFTEYGPAGRPDMSVFRFIRGIAEGKPVTVYGDDTQQPVREPPQLRC